MPFKYMAAVMLGNGLSGILCNIVRALTLFAFPASKTVDGVLIENKDNSFYGALVFFSLSATFCAVSALMMKVMINNKCG